MIVVDQFDFRIVYEFFEMIEWNQMSEMGLEFETLVIYLYLFMVYCYKY
jgi:hypothetical protein